MSLAMNGYAFQSVLHELPIEGEWEFASLETTFFAVPGAVEIVDDEHGRDVTIPCRFNGYATRLLLQSAMATVDSKKATLTDKSLTVTTSDSTTTYLHCSFRGLTREGPAMLDGSGVNGWFQDAALHFRQLKRTA